MPPKFQSSFIPKGAIATGNSSGIPSSVKGRRRSFASLLVSLFFGISVLAALGAIGYHYYLGYSIKNMQKELEEARASLGIETVDELLRTDARISSTEALIEKHQVLSPIFTFLEISTPRTVSFVEFTLTSSADKGLLVTLRGTASSYGSLAGAAKIIQESSHFKDPVFSDLRLDERGNVTFSMKAGVTSDLVSYKRYLSTLSPVSLPVPTSIATTTVGTRSTSTSATTSVPVAPTN